MQPIKMEWAVGNDVHGRPVKLIREKTYLGKIEWRIYREAANQRDESAAMLGLTVDVLVLMGKIAGEVA